jgi:hypothetical protein
MLLFLPLKAVNTSFMDVSNRSPLRLPNIIRNKQTFCNVQPAVPDGSDSSIRTSDTLTENHMRPVTLVTGHIPYLPCGGYHITSGGILPIGTSCAGVASPLLSTQNVVTSMLVVFS